jgi:hypothetical protein
VFLSYSCNDGEAGHCVVVSSSGTGSPRVWGNAEEGAVYAWMRSENVSQKDLARHAKFTIRVIGV